MENGKFLKDISANTVQIGVTQVVNLIVFYLISKYISKEDFGFYNWSMALCSTVIAILSFGMDLIYIRRIAAGVKPEETKHIHFVHTLFTGIVLTLIIYAFQILFPTVLENNLIFSLVLINQVSFSVANSVKLFIIGSERFNYLAVVAIVVNLIKILLISFLFVFDKFTIESILYVFIVSYLLEYVYSYHFCKKLIGKRKKNKIDFVEYKRFIKESMPQLGIILFDSAIARIDWILMGVMTTSVLTAEYSFTFKVFELSKLPLIIIGPILLTRFSRMFKNKDAEITDQKQLRIRSFLDFEIFISILIPLSLICVWSEVIDFLSDNKYGTVNQYTYTILAVAIPIHYLNNFLWSLGIAQNQMKIIMYNIITISILNILMNVVFIREYQSIGAAFSYLIPSIVQLIFYYNTIKQDKIKLHIHKPLTLIISAILILFLVKLTEIHFMLQFIFTLSAFTIISYLLKIFHFDNLKKILNF
jgi:O-antigen/teichoic acid export membrane protein